MHNTFFPFSHLLKPGLVISLFVVLTACVPPNQYAMDIGAPTLVEGQTILSMRQLQSRSFDTLETPKLIEAATATLQDLGFTIEATAPAFGVISGSKDRDAKEAGQVAGQVALAILAALGGSSHQMIYDESQRINVSLVVNKSSETSSIVRVIFDRHITNNQGYLWKADIISDPEIYQEFFERLSQATFLEANQV